MRSMRLPLACARAAAAAPGALRRLLARPPPPPATGGTPGAPRHIASGTTNGIKWINSNHLNPVRGDSSQTGMFLIPLGTASGSPQRYRNVTSALLMCSDFNYLFDCGEGTLQQLRNCFMARTSSISRVFVTHLHGDHIYGLPGFIANFLDSLALDSYGTQSWRLGNKLDERASHLTLYGPLGLHAFVSAAMTTATPRQKAAMPVDVVELLPPGVSAPTSMHASDSGIGAPVKYVKPDADGTYYLYSTHAPTTAGDASSSSQTTDAAGPATWSSEKKSLRTHRHHDVRAALLRHTAHCVGYVVAERPYLNINVDVLVRHGLLPGPHYKDIRAQLEAGDSVTAPDGTVLTLAQVMVCDSPARKVVVLGDNCDASCMVPLAQHADVVLHEATMPPGEESKAHARGHSTPVMAGAFARACNAKALVLTHFGATLTHSHSDSSIHALGRERVMSTVRSMMAPTTRPAVQQAATPSRVVSGNSGSGAQGGGGAAATVPAAAGTAAVAGTAVVARPRATARQPAFPPPAGGFSERAKLSADAASRRPPASKAATAQLAASPPLRFRTLHPPPRGSRALSSGSWGLSGDGKSRGRSGVAKHPAVPAARGGGGGGGGNAPQAAAPTTAAAAPIGGGGGGGTTAGAVPRDAVARGDGDDDAREWGVGSVDMTLLDLVRLGTQPRSIAVLNGVLETARVVSSPAASKPTLVTTTPRANLRHAISQAIEPPMSPELWGDGVELVDLCYPVVEETRGMAPLVAAARDSFGSPRVLAARDFMAICVGDEGAAGDSAKGAGGAGREGQEGESQRQPRPKRV